MENDVSDNGTGTTEGNQGSTVVIDAPQEGTSAVESTGTSDDQTAPPPTTEGAEPAANGAAEAPAADPANQLEVVAKPPSQNGAATSVSTLPVTPASTQTAEAKPAPSQGEGGFFVALLNSAAILLSIAAAVTVALYLIPVKEGSKGTVHQFWHDRINLIAPLAGMAVALIVGVLFGLFSRRSTAPDRLNASVFGDICYWWSELDARIESWCPAPDAAVSGQDETKATACREAQAHRDALSTELGMTKASDGAGRPDGGARWVTGTGYVDLWTRIHGAAEALVMVAPTTDVIGGALNDELRLVGSEIENRDTLLRRLRRAVTALGGGDYLIEPPTPEGEDTTPPAAPDPAAEAKARAVLRDVRRAIYEFRDGRRDGLVRTRNRLAWTGTLTGLTAYALLVLAVLDVTDQTQVFAAVTFYLIGAAVGLFNQLRTDSDNNHVVEEDYGLARARLFHIPVLSGMAAIGGVLATVLLSSTLHATPGGNDVPSLVAIFDVDQNPFGLLVAAVFGLTPGLLVEQLSDRARQYQAELQSTDTQHGGKK
jgi:hypothetical protein